MTRETSYIHHELNLKEYEDLHSLYSYIRKMNLFYGKKNGMEAAMKLWVLANRTYGTSKEEYNLTLEDILEYDGLSDKESTLYDWGR